VFHLSTTRGAAALTPSRSQGHGERLNVGLLLLSPGRRSLLFQTATNTDVVEMFPAKPMELRAFTLCLRFATALGGEREVILFAYRTGSDELNIWREQDGR